jgi:hypothetical protein
MLLHPEHGGNVPTFAVGPRLVQFSGDYSVRPDLHPGFPVLLHGKDMNVVFNPVPGEIALPDFVAELAKPSEKFPKGKKPGYYEWTMGLPGKGLPSQPITEEYLRHLQREGFKKGGSVKKMQAGGDVFGIGDIVGRVTLGSGKPHDVYESLMVAPKGSDVPGVKLSKKKGGQVKGRK